MSFIKQETHKLGYKQKIAQAQTLGLIIIHQQQLLCTLKLNHCRHMYDYVYIISCTVAIFQSANIQFRYTQMKCAVK